MGGLFGGKAPQAQKQQPAGALNVQTSIYGSAYPLVYGKNRVPVNLIHYLNFKAIPHTTKQKTGGKGGGGKTTNTTYTYQVAMAASVGVGGPGTGVGTIWRNKEKHTASSLGLTFFGGAAGQTAWSYLTGAAPSQAVPYANMAYIAGSAFDLGDSPSLPNLNVEFLGLKRYNPGTNDDALLSDIIVDYLTDTRHGAGFGGYLADLDVGNASFRKYCLARGLFISPIENNQRNAGAFLKEMSEISNSAMVWKNGKLHFIPYGDVAITGNGATYTPDLTPIYDLGEKDFLYERGQPPVKHSTKNPSQQFNHVRLEYNNRANDYNPSIVEVKDGADIDDNGLRTKPVRKCTAITVASIARDVAQLEMQRDLFVVNSYSFRLGVRHSLLEPMDYVTITEPGLGLDRQLVRITEVIEQDDAIDVVVEEVNVGVASAPLFNTVGPQGYNQDFNATPGNTQDPLIMNAPGLLTQTGYEMWINACGVNANLWGGCQVWISDDNVTYRLVGDIMGPARYGALAATFAAGSADYDTTSVARVQLYNGQMIGGTQEDVDDWRTLLYIGGEWVSYRDAVLVSGTTYDLDTFRRAGYGSARTSHASGQAVAVIDEATFRLPYDKGNVGKQVYFKFPAFNVFGAGLQDLSACTAYPHTIGASELTAPMNFADVGGNGVNLLPDNYSTLESTSIPTTTSFGFTIARATGVNTKIGSGGAWQLTRSGGGSEAYVYFGANANTPRTPGKKYLISFWYKTNSASFAGNHDIYVTEGTAGIHTASKWNCEADNTWRRACVLLDPTTHTSQAMLFRIDVDTATLGGVLYVDGIMVEEAVGTLEAPSAYSRGQAAGVALSALIAALSAQATADGQVDIYRQSTAPSIGGAGAKYGDYWQDSDDGKWYWCNGSSWVESTDNRLPQAIIDASNAQGAANTAQTTANARIRLFVQEAQPSGGTYIVGDMWYQSSTTLTRYYNGTGWSLQADRTTAVADLMIANGDFEAQNYSWSFENNWYVETSTNAALIGTGLVHAANPSIPASRASNAIQFKVTPGTRIRVQAYIRNLGNAANGVASANVVWADQNANYLGEDGPTYANGTPVTGSTQWRRCVKTITAPANAVYAYVSALVVGHTAGYWCYDNFRASYSVDSLDEVPDGSAYNRTLSTAIQGGIPVGTSSYGANLVPNPGFELNKMGKPVNVFVTSGDVIDGWKLLSSTIGYPMIESGVGAIARSGTNKVTLLANSNVSLPPGTSGDCSIVSHDKIPVNPGERYVVQSFFGVYSDAVLPAGMTWRVAFAMVFYNAAGTYIGEISNNVTNGGSPPGFGTTPLTSQGVAPAGAAYAQFWVLLRLSNPTGGTLVTPAVGTVCLPYFDDLFAAKISNLDNDVDHGSIYGKPANTDLFDDAGVRRIGVNVKGSRKILGGARNSRASIVYGAAAVRTATALTANSSGQVSVNAHNVEISGETVTYNAVSNAVTGLTVGQTYVIFTLDPFLDGGTRTYYAQTSVLNAQQAGEGAVFIGNVTIPSSGTGSGGGPGGGNPGDWCVDWDTMLPDGRYLRDLGKGEEALCIDVATGEVSSQPLLGMRFGEEECYRLVTPELHSVVQSRSAPMDLPNGSVVTTEHMFGKPVYIMEDGKAKLSLVCDLQYLGKRRVLKPDFGNRMFFAGERAEASIATHNAQYKP